MAATTSHQVRDGSRLITFDGEQLGQISSRRPNSSRWTEMAIYRTEGGSYVLEKVGRSVVTHVPGCSEIIGKIPRFQDAHPGDDPEEGYEFHHCVPLDEYDFTTLLVEEDRYWSTISEQPDRIVDALYRRRGSSRHLPRIALDLLEIVSGTCSEFGDDWRVEHIA